MYHVKWFIVAPMTDFNQPAKPVRKPRAKPLDLVRRAALLGVNSSHLAKVISGKRQSARLLVRFQSLLESESASETTPTKNTK
jgi:hypothetical protein